VVRQFNVGDRQKLRCRDALLGCGGGICREQGLVVYCIVYVSIMDSAGDAQKPFSSDDLALKVREVLEQA
jgi:hypothetical protein